MSTVADEERARRKNERELWLLLIGAMLANKSFKAEALGQLSAGDCPFEDLGGFFAGVQRDDQEQAWSWAQRLGAMKDERTTILKATLLSLKESSLRRVCRQAAQLVSASGAIENPEQFVALLKEQLVRVQNKM